MSSEPLDEYFRLFNQVRKAAERKKPARNQAFVVFFLEGILTVINRLHDRVNRLIAVLLYRTRARDLLETKTINDRQYAIITQLMSMHHLPTLSELQRMPWYTALYRKLTAKTRSRDINGLIEQELLRIDEQKRIHLCLP